MLPAPKLFTRTHKEQGSYDTSSIAYRKTTHVSCNETIHKTHDERDSQGTACYYDTLSSAYRKTVHTSCTETIQKTHDEQGSKQCASCTYLRFTICRPAPTAKPLLLPEGLPSTRPTMNKVLGGIYVGKPLSTDNVTAHYKNSAHLKEIKICFKCAEFLKYAGFSYDFCEINYSCRF